MGKWPQKNPKVHVTKDRPMQDNTFDCGIFVCKYVDYFVRGNIHLTKLKWSMQDVTVFRYRIAYELYKCQARALPNDVL